MFDLWGFLLQTLTASGVALLLLAIKALFKDKLPPKWHFTVWGVLGVILLIPAGRNGRYTLIHWQVVVELIKGAVGEYGFSRVRFPIPMITGVPNTIIEWLFVLYVIGVVVNLAKYVVSYVRLRSALSKGQPASTEIIARVKSIAAQLKMKPCRVISVDGLPSAFVCGVLRPVLAVPANEDIDDKILLHELLHLKSRDTVWSILICALRCLHWCNPLIVYCADCTTNDMETRCDQLVLENLEGEERREYGLILLSMVNERFAKTPGTTCVNNGGKHITKRIEAIARFKQYPIGMGLVSICVLVLLTFSLVIGVQASTVYEPNNNSVLLPLASARSTYCTTPAGAFDAYAKSVLDQNGIYRIMCAPVSMQEELINEFKEKEDTGIYPSWDCGLNEWPNSQGGYYIYNLKQYDQNTYEELLVVKVNYPPNGLPGEKEKMYLAVQNLRVEKENGRWVAIPLEDFHSVEASDQNLEWGCAELPGVLYTAVADKFQITAKVQTIHKVDNTIQNANDFNFPFGTTSFFDTTPKPNTRFSSAILIYRSGVLHLGSQEERDLIKRIGLSIAPVYPGEERPTDLFHYTGGYGSGGSSTTGESWGSESTKLGWGPYIEIAGGGGTFNPDQAVILPEFFVADLYVNGDRLEQVDLYPQEGVTQ